MLQSEPKRRATEVGGGRNKQRKRQDLRDQIQVLLDEGAGYTRPLLLRNATLPASAIGHCKEGLPKADCEGNIVADLLIVDGRISSLTSPSPLDACVPQDQSHVDLKRMMVWPCFCDPHAHLLKSQTAPRGPNRTGSINDAYATEFSDRPWNFDDLSRRMDFTIRCAYIHGVRWIRTHLDGTEDENSDTSAASWKAFDAMRELWKGKVELQGVANLYLPLWSKKDIAERQLAGALKRRENVVLGAYCGIIRAKDSEEFLAHFKELFRLARIHDLPVDFHVDENNSGDAVGLLLAAKELAQARAAGYEAPVVFGHCCSLSLVPDLQAEETLNILRSLSGVTIVANPTTNVWLQDRRGCNDFSGVAIPEEPARTPRWRGLTLVQEFQEAGIPVALGGDNVRDWWYNYGDADPIEYLRTGVLLGHLDKPHGSLSRWATSTTIVPRAALGKGFCCDNDVGLAEGSSADLVVFNARCFSELLARPQSDRIVLRSSSTESSNVKSLGLVEPDLPDYCELDDLVQHETLVDGKAILW